MARAPRSATWFLCRATCPFSTSPCSSAWSGYTRWRAAVPPRSSSPAPPRCRAWKHRPWHLPLCRNRPTGPRR
uniref:Putative secreted protein n=1 Tax=Ixodes ricinus TaxID=34613 RepID=A0A6B0TSQ8_IXORI